MERARLVLEVGCSASAVPTAVVLASGDSLVGAAGLGGLLVMLKLGCRARGGSALAPKKACNVDWPRSAAGEFACAERRGLLTKDTLGKKSRRELWRPDGAQCSALAVAPACRCWSNSLNNVQSPLGVRGSCGEGAALVGCRES